MSEIRKTRGRQRIPIKLIENKDDLLVSFSKRRVGVYKKASELSTLCGVDVGAIIFSPSGIPHSFFTPDFDTVVHGRRNAPDQQRDGYGRVVAAEGNSRSKILELNKQLDEVVELQEREERREKQLGGVVNPAEMGWWEVPGESLDMQQVKEQIEWFQTLKAQIKIRAQELKNGASSSAAQPRNGDGLGGLGVASHMGGECFLAPTTSLDAYGGGGGNGHVGDQYRFPPPPPPQQHFDGGGGSSLSLTAQRYLYPPAPPHFDMSNSGGGSGLMAGQYGRYPAPSLNQFGGGGIGHDPEQSAFYPPSPAHGHGGINHLFI